MQEMLLKLLQNPIVLAVLSGVVTYLFMFIDTKVTRQFKSSSTYYKNTGLVSSLVGLSLFLSKSNLGNLFKGGNMNLTQNKENLNNNDYEFDEDDFDS